MDTNSQTVVALRRELRIAKGVFNAVPILGGFKVWNPKIKRMESTPAGRWTNHYRALANQQVRQIHRQMEKHGIDPSPEFFKPLESA
jgi:hypothetical protein